MMNVDINGRSNAFEFISTVRFYTIEDVMEMTNWSEKTVRRLFNDPAFPSADYGKNKLVEQHALIQFFSKKHDRTQERYWRD